MPVSTAKSKSLTIQKTENSSLANTLQGYDNQQTSLNLSDIDLKSGANLSLETTDYGAIGSSMDLANRSLDNAAAMSMALIDAQNKSLTQYFDQSASVQKESMAIAGAAAGSSWRDKALIAGAIVALVVIVVKGRK